MNGKIYCSLCGMENYPLLKYCDNCGKLLKTNRIAPEPVYDTFNDVLIHNKYRILKTNITEDTYNKIIENIERIILMNLNFHSNETCLFRVYKLVQQFSRFYYDNQKNTYMYFSGDTIFYNDKISETEKICKLLHELASHLYSEIFEQILMYIFNSKKNTYIEAFVTLLSAKNSCYILSKEYLACVSENYFTRNLMNNYLFVVNIIQERNMDTVVAKKMCMLGNTVADDVIKILDRFIPEQFREEIQEQAFNDNIEHVSMSMCDVKKISNSEKIDLIKAMIEFSYSALSENSKDIMDINRFIEDFKMINRN